MSGFNCRCGPGVSSLAVTVDETTSPSTKSPVGPRNDNVTGRPFLSGQRPTSPGNDETFPTPARPVGRIAYSSTPSSRRRFPWRRPVWVVGDVVERFLPDDRESFGSFQLGTGL